MQDARSRVSTWSLLLRFILSLSWVVNVVMTKSIEEAELSTEGWCTFRDADKYFPNFTIAWNFIIFISKTGVLCTLVHRNHMGFC